MVFPFRDAVSARRSTFIASLVHGRPTIATGVHTGPFVDGTNCVLLADMTPERLAGSMRRLLTDEAFRQRLGAQAGKLAREFDWGRNGETHTALYRELLSDRPIRD